MSEYNYDSYCGIYCGACSVMMSHKTGRKDPLALQFNEKNIRSYLASQGEEYPEGEDFSHNCTGCKTSTRFINCRPCKIRKCAVEKKIEHCIECGDYPCQLYSSIMGNPKVHQMLPHTKCSVKNLERIKEVGRDQWLNEQEKQWQCPDCQTSFSWYAGKCASCGRSLADVKQYGRIKTLHRIVFFLAGLRQRLFNK